MGIVLLPAMKSKFAEGIHQSGSMIFGDQRESSNRNFHAKWRSDRFVRSLQATPLQFDADDEILVWLTFGLVSPFNKLANCWRKSDRKIAIIWT